MTCRLFASLPDYTPAVEEYLDDCANVDADLAPTSVDHALTDDHTVDIPLEVNATINDG